MRLLVEIRLWRQLSYIDVLWSPVMINLSAEDVQFESVSHRDDVCLWKGEQGAR